MNCDASSSSTSLYKCPKCEKSYSIAKSLRNHCRMSHDLISIAFCKICDAVFVNQEANEEHQLTHTTTTTTPKSPSSPEEFYGFTTPTKDVEKAKELLSIKRKLSLFNF